METKQEIILTSGKRIKFCIRSFHYRNPELRQSFTSKLPTIVALYKRMGRSNIFERITVQVIDNPFDFFNSEPILEELRQTKRVLLLDEPLLQSQEKAIEYLEQLRHEVIEVLSVHYQFD